VNGRQLHGRTERKRWVSTGLVQCGHLDKVVGVRGALEGAAVVVYLDQLAGGDATLGRVVGVQEDGARSSGVPTLGRR
jgi:hypothetical protein